MILPFRRVAVDLFEFALFRREDAGYWQGIAGGGEEGESPADAAIRESQEEAGLSPELPYFSLDTTTMIPICHFAARKYWPSGLYVIPEYAFAVDATGAKFALSKEHTEVVWGKYADIYRRLRWDSNRTALWELQERLGSGDLVRVQYGQ